MGLPLARVASLCERGGLPVAMSAAGEQFVISRDLRMVEVAALRKGLGPMESEALDRWLRGEFETPSTAMAAAGAREPIARGERSRERSALEGAS